MNDATTTSQTVPDTENPQSNTATTDNSPGSFGAPNETGMDASDSTDFQSSSADLLNEKTKDIKVESTGDRSAEARLANNGNYSAATYAWGAALLAALVISVWLVRYILKPQAGAVSVDPTPVLPSKPATSSKSSKAKSNKKSPPHRRKKSTKKKR